MTRLAAVRFILGAICLVLAGNSVSAHESRPALLQLTEIEANRFDVLWRVPARGNRILSMRPRFPEQCRAIGPAKLVQDVTRAERRQILACDDSLAGSRIVIAGIEGLRTDVLIRIDYINGGTETQRATPSAPSVELAGRRDLYQVAGAYLTLGIEHILLGIDHLLFVVALMLIVRGWRRLVATVTAFTLAHSITLAGATLGFLSVPTPLIEALIALSIVFVAAEAIHMRNGRHSLATSKPWLIAFAFGLLHGFGFANALNQIGLPPEAIPVALLFFNLGVEAGQLVFIAVLLIVVRAALDPAGVPINRFAKPGAYAIGILAAFWTAERVAAFLVV